MLGVSESNAGHAAAPNDGEAQEGLQCDSLTTRPIDPEIAAALDAIDATLAGEAVDPSTPSSRSSRCCSPTSGPPWIADFAHRRSMTACRRTVRRGRAVTRNAAPRRSWWSGWLAGGAAVTARGGRRGAGRVRVRASTTRAPARLELVGFEFGRVDCGRVRAVVIERRTGPRAVGAESFGKRRGERQRLVGGVIPGCRSHSDLAVRRTPQPRQPAARRSSRPSSA